MLLVDKLTTYIGIYNAVQSVKNQLKFQRNMSPPSAGQRISQARNLVSMDYMELYPK